MKRLNYTLNAKETAYGKKRQRLLCWMKESQVSGLSYMPRWIPEGEEPGEMGSWIRAPWLDEPVNISDLIAEKLAAHAAKPKPKPTTKPRRKKAVVRKRRR